MRDQETVVSGLIDYMAWANRVMIDNARQLPEDELIAPKDTLFGSIAGTFDHILLIATVFRAHLQGVGHGYTSRKPAAVRPFAHIAAELEEVDRFLVAYVHALDEAQLREEIVFPFIDGGTGCLTRAEILLHLVNHATYHRGFISTLLYPYGLPSQANDLTVFLAQHRA